jgi:hypothetical protein
MPIRQIDNIPHIDSEPVADPGQLVCKRDVGIAECVFRELDKLGRPRRADDARAAHKMLVEALCPTRTSRRDPPDATVVLD